ncbi:hypothetical protein PR202_gb00810 [Eleusine coracana subsp. coracana]|uniref:Uncharacterized protein n=1 Tax=Eleusine coracana subsp. coracana TaxID=191504 RepID=A0AAV5DVT6_ELECO|nr:hypothetical protein PR202_gb00810 [Eleusine coracana subsp. coracana]
MATTEGMVPITRAYLSRYYDKYPLPPLPDAVVDLAARLRALSADLVAVAPTTPGERRLPRWFLCPAAIRCSLALLAAVADL